MTRTVTINTCNNSAFKKSENTLNTFNISELYKCKNVNPNRQLYSYLPSRYKPSIALAFTLWPPKLLLNLNVTEIFLEKLWITRTRKSTDILRDLNIDKSLLINSVMFLKRNITIYKNSTRCKHRQKLAHKQCCFKRETSHSMRCKHRWKLAYKQC